MLILTRQENEEVVVTIRGIQCRVKITEIRGNKVRIGFAGDRKAVMVNRAEVQAPAAEEGRRRA